MTGTAKRRHFHPNGVEATAAEEIEMMAEAQRQRDAERSAEEDEYWRARAERLEAEEARLTEERLGMSAADGTAAGRRFRLG